jgi:hypothetical protein
MKQSAETAKHMAPPPAFFAASEQAPYILIKLGTNSRPVLTSIVEVITNWFKTDVCGEKCFSHGGKSTTVFGPANNQS